VILIQIQFHYSLTVRLRSHQNGNQAKLHQRSENPICKKGMYSPQTPVYTCINQQ